MMARMASDGDDDDEDGDKYKTRIKYACVCVCVCECLCAALVLVIRMIRANSPHSCPAALPLLPLVCCLLLLLLLFYSHSHIVYVSMCVCASCIVSVFCHGHGLSRRVCVCVYLPLCFWLCARLFMCVRVCVLVRWGRRRSYVFACCSVGFDSVLDGWYGLALDRRLPAWLPLPSPHNPCSVVVAAFHPYISRSPFARLALANGDEDRAYIYECLSLCVRVCRCALAAFDELFVLQFCVLFFFLLLIRRRQRRTLSLSHLHVT